MLEIKVGETYTTRDGRTVRIIGEIPNTKYPFVGYLLSDIGPLAWTKTGHYSVASDSSELDLVSRVVPTVRKYQAIIRTSSGEDFMPGKLFTTATEVQEHYPSHTVIRLIEPGFDVPVEV